MDKPLCPLCKHKHYSHEDHIFPDTGKREGAATTKKVAPIPQTKSTPGATSGKSKFDRAAYQKEYMRDYMRERRAKEKGE